jgi:hypothetical protein
MHHVGGPLLRKTVVATIEKHIKNDIQIACTQYTVKLRINMRVHVNMHENI